MPDRTPATMQKKRDGRKKNKRHWINLKDKSQRWSHEKKLRDIRARAALKKQRRKGLLEEDGELQKSDKLHGGTEHEEEKEKDLRKQHFPVSSCDVSESYGSLAADPDDFLERLYNPSYLKGRKKVGTEENCAQSAGTATLAEEKCMSASQEELELASNMQKTLRFAGKYQRDADKSKSCARTGKRGRKGEEIDIIEARHSGDEEHSEVTALLSDSDLREGDVMGSRTRKLSRRQAVYSPHSASAYREENFNSKQKKKASSKDLLTAEKKSSITVDMKKGPPGRVDGASSTLMDEISEKSASRGSSSDFYPSKKVRKITGKIEEEMCEERKEDTGRHKSFSASKEDIANSSASQSVSLPKGVFYPFQKAMREAARRKAAQEEERKRRQEEQEKVEKEKEISRRKRAKQRRQLIARTSKGQPVMKNVMKLLLDRIKNSA